MKVFGITIGKSAPKKTTEKESAASIKNAMTRMSLKTFMRTMEENPELQLQFAAKALKFEMPTYLEQVAQKVIANDPDLQYKMAEAKINQMLGGNGPKSLKDQIEELRELSALISGNQSNSGFMTPDMMALAKMGIEAFGSIVIANNPKLAARVANVGNAPAIEQPRASSNGHHPAEVTETSTVEIDYTNNIEVFKHYLSVLMNIVDNPEYSPEDAARIALHELNRIANRVREFDPEMKVAEQINGIIQQPPQMLLSTLSNLVAFAGNDPRIKLTLSRLSTEEGIEYLTRFRAAIAVIYAEAESKNNDENE